MIVVTGQIFLVDEQVVIFVQLPEFAVDDVEVFVAEVVGDLVDVLLVLEQVDGGQQVRLAQLGQRDVARPRPVDLVKYARYDLNGPKRRNQEPNERTDAKKSQSQQTSGCVNNLSSEAFGRHLPCGRIASEIRPPP